MNFFIANWKMQLSVKQSVDLARKIKNGLKKIPKNTRVILCPSFDALKPVAKVLGLKKDVKRPGLPGRPGLGTILYLGAQDMFWAEKGAFTGEVSPSNLKNMGCKYVILGHSERRKLGETDEQVQKKTVVALKDGLVPIVCIGETLKERKCGRTRKVLQKQLGTVLKNIKFGSKNKIIIAYEPVWAIGTGIFADSKDVGKVKDFISKLLQKYFKKKELERITIVYGGSVDSKNISKFMTTGKMQGALIGGASLKAGEFIKIIHSVTNYK